MRPDQIVIGKTAARVITSHLPTVSSRRCSGGFAVSRISFQASSRSRSGTGASTVASWAVVLIWVLVRFGKRASRMYHVPMWIRRRGPGGCTGWHDAAMTDPTVPPIVTAHYSLVSMSVPFMRSLLARDLVRGRDRDRRRRPVRPSGPPRRVPSVPPRRSRGGSRAQPWLGRAIVAAEAGRPAGHRLGRLPRPARRGRSGEVGYHVDPGTAAVAWSPRPSGRSSTGRRASTASTRFRAAHLARQRRLARGGASRFGFRQVGEPASTTSTGLELIFELDGWPPRPERAGAIMAAMPARRRPTAARPRSTPSPSTPAPSPTS